MSEVENVQVEKVSTSIFNENFIPRPEPTRQEEAPEVENSAEDKTPDTPASEAQAPEVKPDTPAEPPKPAEVDFSTLTKGRFKTPEELDAFIQEKESVQPKKYHELADKLNEFLEVEGRNPDDFWKIVNRDFSSLSDMDKIKENMRLNNKEGLTDEEIDILVSERYKPIKLPRKPDETALPEEMEAYEDAVAEAERRQKLQAIELKREAAKAAEELNALKEKYKVTPKDTIDPKAEEEQGRLVREQARGEISKFLDPVEKFEEEFLLDEKNNVKLNFSYKLSGEEKDVAKSVYTMERNFWEKYMKGDGSFDMQSFSKDMVFLQSREKYIKAAVQQAYNQGKEEILRDRVNPNVPPVQRDVEGKSVINTGLFR